MLHIRHLISPIDFHSSSSQILTWILLCSSLRPPLLDELPSLSNPLQNLLSIFVQLQLRHNDFAGVNTERYRLAVGLIAGDSLEVDEVFEAVDGGDFAFTAFVGAADDCDFVVFADGN
jgi:hypothetical protein